MRLAYPIDLALCMDPGRRPPCCPISNERWKNRLVPISNSPAFHASCSSKPTATQGSSGFVPYLLKRLELALTTQTLSKQVERHVRLSLDFLWHRYLHA
jgi:hypothetical protein